MRSRVAFHSVLFIAQMPWIIVNDLSFCANNSVQWNRPMLDWIVTSYHQWRIWVCSQYVWRDAGFSFYLAAIFGIDSKWKRGRKRVIQLRAGAKVHVFMAIVMLDWEIFHNLISWPGQKPQARRNEPIVCIAVWGQVMNCNRSVPCQILPNVSIIVSLC